MAGRKRPFSSLELTEYPAIVGVGVDMKPSYGSLPYAESVNTNFASTYPPTFSNFSPFTFPLDYNIFDAVCQSSGLYIEPLLAFDHSVVSFQPDLNNSHMSSPSGYLSDSGPASYHFSQLQGNGQPHTAHEPSHSPTMNQSLQPYGNRPNKRRSITSMDGPSIHGRSDGSEYYIDSPYDFQGDVMTPTTAQSYEMVERPPSENNNDSSGMLTHEDDLIGLEIHREIP